MGKVSVGLILFGMCALFSIVTVFMFIGTYNDLNEQKQGIVAQYDQDRNVYDNMFKSFREAAQVPAMYADDLKKVYDSAITGRYGQDGSKAAIQFIQEHNPTYDPGLYKDLMATLKSGRLRFEENQKNLLDRQRAYNTKIHSFPANIVAALFGFHELSKYGIVTSGETERAFETKKAEPIQLR